MARTRNPIPQMPGGSVTACIEIMTKRGDIDDPGAYCAAIADQIEPGWRENPENPRAGVRARNLARKVANPG